MLQQWKLRFLWWKDNMNYLVSTGVSRWLLKWIFSVVMQTGNSLVLISMTAKAQGNSRVCSLGKICVGFSWFKWAHADVKSWENHEKKQQGVGRCILTRRRLIPLQGVAKTNPSSSDWVDCPGSQHWVPFVGEHTVPTILYQPTDNCCVLINCIFLYYVWLFSLWWQFQSAKLILKAEI